MSKCERKVVRKFALEMKTEPINLANMGDE